MKMIEIETVKIKTRHRTGAAAYQPAGAKRIGLL